jgi:hypothetical protein
LAEETEFKVKLKAIIVEAFTVDFAELLPIDLE